MDTREIRRFEKTVSSLFVMYYNGILSLFPRRDITRIVRIKRKIVERNIDRLGGNNAIFSESRIETVK